MGIVRNSLLIAPVIAVIVIHLKVIRPPTKWAENTVGSLLGEVYIHSKQDAFEYAKQAVVEGYSIWDEPSTNWETMFINGTKLHVEARRITEGPFATSNILLSRAVGTIEGADADKIYDHMIKPEGLLLLDPNMDLEKAGEYYERFKKDDNTYLDVHKSFIPMPPGVEDRYHLVLNGYYKKERFFFCKSIVHDSVPGSSPYYQFENQTSSSPTSVKDEHGVRSVSTFYFHMEPTKDKKSTIVSMVNFADMQMGSTMMNWLISKAFYPGVYARIEEMFGDNKK